MINKNSQKGSAHIVIIVILIIALLGTLGFIFWQNFVHKDNSKNTDTTAQIDNSQETTSEDAVEKDKLILNDWGIAFTIPSLLLSTEVKYQAKDTDIYVFTTARVQALGGECAKSPFGDTVNLTRMLEKPIAVPDGELLNESPIQNYYYVLSGPISSCSSLGDNQESGVDPVETADRDALRTMLKTLSEE